MTRVINRNSETWYWIATNIFWSPLVECQWQLTETSERFNWWFLYYTCDLLVVLAMCFPALKLKKSDELIGGNQIFFVSTSFIDAQSMKTNWGNGLRDIIKTEIFILFLLLGHLTSIRLSLVRIENSLTIFVRHIFF